jgi:UDP-galactopyranose mutase
MHCLIVGLELPSYIFTYTVAKKGKHVTVIEKMLASNFFNKKYVELSKSKVGNVVFGGRLYQYRYYNMKKTIVDNL